MLAIAFATQNFTLGMTYGSVGPMMAPVQEQFGATRTEASMMLSMVTLSIGLASPLIGSLLHRVSIRNVMLAGTMLSVAAYLLLTQVTSKYELLALYGVIGVGAGISGLIAPLTLVSRWFDAGRGRALGILNMPIVMLITPVVTVKIVADHGLHMMFGLIASTFLLLLPIQWFVIDRPVVAPAPPPNATRVASADIPLMTTRQVLTNSKFWRLTLAMGLLTGASIIIIVHIVPFAVSLGYEAKAGAALLSTYSLAGAVGTYLFGWLADRLRPTTALVLNAFIQSGLWLALTLCTSLPALTLLVGLIGMCMTSIVPLYGASVSQLFGPENVSRPMGIAYFLKIPVMFASAPITAYAYQLSGGYFLPFSILAAISLGCGFLLATLTLRPRQRGY